MCEILPKNAQNLLVTTLKILQLLGDLVPRPRTRAPPVDPAGDSRPPDLLWFWPHPKHSSAAYESRVCQWSLIWSRVKEEEDDEDECTSNKDDELLQLKETEQQLYFGLSSSSSSSSSSRYEQDKNAQRQLPLRIKIANSDSQRKYKTHFWKHLR